MKIFSFPNRSGMGIFLLLALFGISWDAPPTRVKVTAYCPCAKCCGHMTGRTSTGSNAWKPGIAADPRAFAYGTMLNIPGYGYYKVDDTGGALKKSYNKGVLHLDVRFKYHYQATSWGVKYFILKKIKE